MHTKPYSFLEVQILTLRSVLVSYWGEQVLQCGHEAMIDTYTDYAEALDALDPDNPGHVATLEYAAKVLHEAIKLISNVRPEIVHEIRRCGGDIVFGEGEILATSTDEVLVDYLITGEPNLIATINRPTISLEDERRLEAFHGC
jgi:hypothetical protein